MLGTQHADYEINPDVFATEIAPARTIGFTKEIEQLQAMGLAKGGSTENVIVYDDDKTAIEKIRAFIDATIISTDNVSAEGTELQKTVDLEENRYMLDKLSHKIIEKLTIYFERIINQGISEKTFFVKYPSETAEFLMTAYVFVSNNMSIRYSKKESVNEYLNAFKIMLEQSLNAQKIFSN